MSNRKMDYLDLNQENVLSVYKNCLVPKDKIGTNTDVEHKVKIFSKETCGKDSPEVVFDINKLDEQANNIAFLLGQLKVTHDQATGFTLPMGFLDYKNRQWTKDNTTLMALYYLGVGCNFMPIFKKLPNENKVFSTAILLVPYYSLKDCKFKPFENKDAASLDDDQ